MSGRGDAQARCAIAAGLRMRFGFVPLEEGAL
jgi:hypothetical protein